MNQFSRNKVLLSIIAILLITNLVMLYFFLQMQRHHDHDKKRPGFTEKLKKEVGFTPEQMSVYEPKKKMFWKSMREKFDAIKTTKVNFYNQMYNSSIPDSVLESKAQVIGKQQKELDLYVIRHFRDVRKMCTPQQLPKFDSLLPPIIERMTARPDKK